VTKEVEEEKNCDEDNCVSSEHKSTCAPFDLPYTHTIKLASKKTYALRLETMSL